MKLLNTSDIDQFSDCGGYYQGGECDVTPSYKDIVAHVHQSRGIPLRKIVLLDDWQAGEICIYLDGKWSGYVSDYKII